MRSVKVALGARSYDIQIGSGLLARPDTWAGLPKAQAAMIVTNDTVAPLYADRLQAKLSAVYGRVDRVVLPDGEAYKSWETLNKMKRRRLQNG